MSAGSRQATGTTTPDRGIALLFGGLMLSMLLASLNQTVLATALPTIVGELRGVEHMAWVITAFILTATISMPIYGRLSDLLGGRWLLVVAIGLFTAGSVIGGLAGDMTWLVVGRVVQGLGGGGLIILSQAIIADVVPARERGRYMGIMGGVFAFSSVAGPLLGGWFTEGPGWRWVFWINLPLGALAALAAILFLHPTRERESRIRVDHAGMALMALATTALVLVGTWAGTRYAWTSPEVLVLAAVALVAGGLFVLVESRAAVPVIPLHLFRDRNFTLTTVAALTTGVAMFGAIGYMPTYLQMAAGASATMSGLLMVPLMGTLLVTSIVAGHLVSRTGRYKAYPIAGSLVVAVGLGLLATVRADTSVAAICAYLAVLGIGLGGSMQILVLIVQNSFPRRLVGTATAATTFFRQIGATLGAAVVGSLFTTRLAASLGSTLEGHGVDAETLTPAVVETLPVTLREPVMVAYTDALIPLFLLMVPLALVAAAALCFVEEKPLATTLDPEVPAEVSAGATGGGRLPVGAAAPGRHGAPAGPPTGSGSA